MIHDGSPEENPWGCFHLTGTVEVIFGGISFRVGDAPIEGNLNMQQAYQAHEAGVPYESILRNTQEAIMLNQYARRANEGGSIYQGEIRDLQVQLEKIWQTASGTMEALAAIT